MTQSLCREVPLHIRQRDPNIVFRFSAGGSACFGSDSMLDSAQKSERRSWAGVGRIKHVILLRDAHIIRCCDGLVTLRKQGNRQ